MSRNMFYDVLTLMVYVTLPPFVCASVLHTIFADDIMKHHYFLTVYLCVCFFVLICLITLSQVCKLRRKPKAVSKPLSRLYDSDLEPDDDTEVSRGEEIDLLWRILEKYYLLLSYRHIYTVIAFVGALLIIPVLVSFAGWYLSGTFSLKDLSLALWILIFAAIFLECIILVVSNIYNYDPPKTSNRPFDEFVRVPMKVFVSKVLALCYKKCSVPFHLFYQLSAFYGLMAVYNMPEEQIAKFEEADSDGIQVYELMRNLMRIANILGVFMLIEGIWMTCDQTKERLLMTFEKNWERNLKAFEFLLHDKDVETFDQLRDALLEKINQENLTAEEEKTLQYIARPLWKSKRSFLDKPMGIERPRINLLDPPKETSNNPPAEPSVDEPSTSGTQPSTSGTQPSTSGTTIQLRSRKAR